MGAQPPASSPEPAPAPAGQTGRRPVRIAHAYANARKALDRALASKADGIEADVWYTGSDIHIRHDRKFGPLLADRRMKGHDPLPWSVPLPRGYYVRPDINPITLDELLDRAKGRKRLLLDLKGKYSGRGPHRFARRLSRTIERHDAREEIEICGQIYNVLDAIREAAPELHVRYSIERPPQWEAFKRRAEADEKLRSVCMQHLFFDDEKERYLKDLGAGVYCWTVDVVEAARGLVERGVDGVISNNLELLAEL